MKNSIVHAFRLLPATALMLGVVASSASAQTTTAAAVGASSWPAKPISLIVPFPAGGTTDVLARAVGVELAKAVGQPVIVENKPGAGATLGADVVAKSRADGHTLLMGAVHHTIATSVYKKLPYDFQKDFAPVTTVALVPNVLVVNPNVAAKNVKELLALAKAEPGNLTYGSNGAGTGQHLIGAQFESQGGVQLLHVPYKGSGPLTVDLLGGQIAMSFDTITPVLPQIKSGKLRALAVTTIKRSPALPDVPTLDEAGLKGFDLGTWFGILAPAAMSDLAAALAGSLGIAPTGNIDPERRYPSMFEPIHGSAFDIMGKGLANPVGTFWSCVMLLEHIGEAEAAKTLMGVIEKVTANPALHTGDLGGKATTAQVTQAVCELIAETADLVAA